MGPDRVRNLDVELTASGVTTATEMLSGYSRKVKRLLQSKALKKEEDFRLLRTIFDAEPSRWSAAEREAAASLLDAFETPS